MGKHKNNGQTGGTQGASAQPSGMQVPPQVTPLTDEESTAAAALLANADGNVGEIDRTDAGEGDDAATGSPPTAPADDAFAGDGDDDGGGGEGDHGQEDEPNGTQECASQGVPPPKDPPREPETKDKKAGKPSAPLHVDAPADRVETHRQVQRQRIQRCEEQRAALQSEYDGIGDPEAAVHEANEQVNAKREEIRTTSDRLEKELARLRETFNAARNQAGPKSDRRAALRREMESLTAMIAEIGQDLAPMAAAKTV